MKSLAADTICIAGIGCIVAAGFMVYTPLGLVVLGAPLVALAIHMKRPKK